MKTSLALLAAAAVLGFAAPSSAKADHLCNGSTRVVGYTSCGTPIVAVYRIVGYDHCGRPVGQWVTQPARPSYGSSGYRPGYAGSSPHRGHHGHPGSSPRSGVNFSFGFSR